MDKDSSNPPQQTSPSRFRAFRTLLVIISVAGLLSANIASLVSSSAHDAMYNALWRVLSIAGLPVAKILENSPTSRTEAIVKKRTAELEDKNKKLEVGNRRQAVELDQANTKNQKLVQQIDDVEKQKTELEDKNQKLETENRRQAVELDQTNAEKQKLVQQMDANGKQAKATASKVNKRLAKNISINIAALPPESIPYTGIIVTGAVTALDIYDACQTMKDFNALLRLMGQGEENPDVCGRKVPTLTQVLGTSKPELQNAVEHLKNELKARKMPVPDIHWPTRNEVREAVCNVVSMPYLCREK